MSKIVIDVDSKNLPSITEETFCLCPTQAAVSKRVLQYKRQGSGRAQQALRSKKVLTAKKKAQKARMAILKSIRILANSQIELVTIM